MAPSTRKRKLSPNPSCTLMDFFSGADPAKKRARVKPAQIKTAPRATIVVADDILCRREKESSPLHYGTGGSEDLVTMRSKDKDIFGLPLELLCPIAPNVKTSCNPFHLGWKSSTVLKPDQPEPMFGVPGPLLGQTRAESDQLSCPVRENSTIMVEGDSVADSVVMGEWGFADDELVNPELSDNSADTHVKEHLDELFCPVCGVDLSKIFLESQIHVNRCLDKTLEGDNFALQGSSSIPMPIKPDVTSDNNNPNPFVEDKGNDLYTVLMNSHKKRKIYAGAHAIADCDLKPFRGNRRKAPFYKVLQGMPIAVDAFCYGAIPGVTAYFLTHAHSDHYTSLGSKWNSGPIYCSEETARLIIHILAVNPSWIRPLPLDTPTIIPNTGGVSVTLIEANHCPGSCLFFFEGQQTVVGTGDGAFKPTPIGPPRIFRYLHCGDFRASPRHVLHPAVNGKHIDCIYLDTTYLDSKYTFSPQPLVISACAELACRVAREVTGNSHIEMHQSSTLHAWMKPPPSAEGEGRQRLRERVLVMVGTYLVGKERIVKAIAQALGVKIYCDTRKAAILRCQADPELHALLTADPAEAGVHVLPLGALTLDNLKLYLRRFKGTFSRIIGFRPTGWTYSPPSGSNSDKASIQSIIIHGQSRHFSFSDIQLSQKSSYNIQIFGIPYSEHSSFFELTCFAMSCDWGRIIPTVNMGSATSRANMMKWLNRWESEKRRTKLYIIQPRTADYW